MADSGFRPRYPSGDFFRDSGGRHRSTVVLGWVRGCPQALFRPPRARVPHKTVWRVLMHFRTPWSTHPFQEAFPIACRPFSSLNPDTPCVSLTNFLSSSGLSRSLITFPVARVCPSFLDNPMIELVLLFLLFVALIRF